MALKFRDATPIERTEATRQWVASYCPGSGKRISIGAPGRTMTTWLWLRLHRAAVDALLVEPDTHIVVAVLDDRPLDPLGWVCWTDARTDDGKSIPPSLHYVYVIESARRHGLGSRLIARAPDNAVATHATASGTALLTARTAPRQEQHA
jgi:GNAT superfamily N-acetyltransferase